MELPIRDYRYQNTSNTMHPNNDQATTNATATTGTSSLPVMGGSKRTVDGHQTAKYWLNKSLASDENSNKRAGYPSTNYPSLVDYW